MSKYDHVRFAYRQIARIVCLTLLCGFIAACSAGQAGLTETQATNVQQSAYAPSNLKVESQVNPIGVSRSIPRLSWQSGVRSQAAYEIEAASDLDRLNSGNADLWSSGKTEDGRSVLIPYRGKGLASRKTAYWRVRVWGKGSENPGPWSKPASWQMALLSAEDWEAAWIAAPLFEPAKSTPGIERWLEATAKDPQFRDRERAADTVAKLRAVRPAAYFRRDFTISKPVKSARLYSTSAGYSEFFLSGQKIGDRVLNPAQTDFDKRIYYDVDDLGDRLTVGNHTLAAHLGNGFYGERTAFGLDKLFYGEPALIAQLEIHYQDGTTERIVTDGSWRSAPSPILKNGVYSGEVFDARAQIADWAAPSARNANQWQPAQSLEEAPTRSLIAAEMPPVRRITAVKPKVILNPEPGVWTIDFGQNFTGLPNVDVAKLGLKRDQTVIFRYAEWADDKGNVGMNSGGGAPRTKQVDAYVSDGVDAQPWSPSFTWHGFRYMEITGLEDRPDLSAITAHLTRTDVPRIGRFSSSSDLLNTIHDMALWSFEANLVSVPSDCPIRERNGWTGDAHAIVQMASYNYEMGPFLEKYLGDFRTTEEIAPTIVPGRRTRSGMIDWASAEVFLTWEHYLHSGDASVIERQYDSMLEYVAYVDEVADGDLFTNGNHFYGDWCDTLPELGMERPLGRCRSFSTPAEITTAALMARMFGQMADMASIMGRDAEAGRFADRREAIRNAFHAAYFKNEEVGYGSQTANAMALSFELAPEGNIAGLAAAIDRDVREKWGGHASVGALGQTWLYPALSDNGFTDTAFGVFTAEGAPGYRYQIETLGATTLWEDVTKYVPSQGRPPGKSLNHPFKGGYDAWFYSGLGGINPDPKKPGYKHFFLKPAFPQDLEHANVSLETGYGTIRSNWKREGDQIRWDFSVPANTSATISLPAGSFAPRSIGPGSHTIFVSKEGDREIVASAN